MLRVGQRNVIPWSPENSDAIQSIDRSPALRVDQLLADDVLAEATYFLKNCLGTKMDGDHDGVPCEDHLCR